MKSIVLLLICFNILDMVLAIGIQFETGNYNNNYDGNGGKGGNDGYYSGHKHRKPKHRKHHYSYSNSDEDSYQKPDHDIVPMACADGWTSFTRVKGQWCIKVFPGFVPLGTAESECQALGATLTSLENDAERLFIYNQATTFMTANDRRTMAIGARRKAACYASNWLSIPECMPKQTNSFYWTDNFTTGDAGWAWQTLPDQPDNFSTGQSYGTMIINTGSWLQHYTSVGQPLGMLDDAEATMGVGYACGKKPDVKQQSSY